MNKKYSRKYVYDREGLLLPLKERTYKTNEGYDCVLINAGSKVNYITCKIEEYVFEALITNIKKGIVKYPFHPSVHGKGYIGKGKYKTGEDKKHTKAYKLWSNMLERAYDEKYHKKRPTYKDVEVCEEWYNFQVFALWFYNESNYQEGWRLDKDLLSEDKKIYSPQTCVFIPQALNSFLTNKQTNNTSGYVGVSWCKANKKWKVCINDIKLGKNKHLGYFGGIEEATKAYKNEREEYAKIWRDKMKELLPNAVIERIA